MSEWVLILMLFHGRGGAAVDHIGGFASKAQCEQAAAALPADDARHIERILRKCVERTATRAKE